MRRFIFLLALFLAACTTPWDIEQTRIQENGRSERAGELYAREADAQAREAQALADAERSKADAELFRTQAEKIRADAQAQAIAAFFKAWGWYVALGVVAFALVLGGVIGLAAVKPRVVYLLPGREYPRLGAGRDPADVLFLSEWTSEEVNRKT